MKKEVLLEQMVDMMSTINEGTLRSTRIFYCVNASRYPETKLVKFVFEKIKETTGKHTKIKNHGPIVNLCQGRLYAHAKFDEDSETIDLDFYFTKKPYDYKQLSSDILAANKTEDQNPDFARGAFLLDSEKISLRQQPTGKNIPYLDTSGLSKEDAEKEQLQSLNRLFRKITLPTKLKIGSEVFEDVVGFIKKPEGGSADFVAIDSNEERIPGTGLSIKTSNFGNYKNLTSYRGGDDPTSKDVARFIDAVESKWKQRLLYPSAGDIPYRSTAGFYRPVKMRKSRIRDLVYGQDYDRADYISIGNLVVDNSGNIPELAIKGEGVIYQYPEIPTGDYTPVLFSRYGGKGYLINLDAKDLATLNVLFPESKGDDLTKKLKDFKLQDIIVVQPMGIDTPIVKSANLSIRLFSIPRGRLPKKAEQV